METIKKPIGFTGEFFVPGQSGNRLEQDHLERYLFAQSYAQGKSVLDIACGTGYGSKLLIEGGATSYLGVDINETAIAYANEHYASDLVRYELGDICTFAPGQTFDLITCFETIEHISQYREALKNLSKLLNKGGLLIVSSPHRAVCSPNAKTMAGRPVNPFHTQEFLPDELTAELLECGFECQPGEVYGQRQRPYSKLAQTICSFRLSRIAYLLATGNPNANSSPKVALVEDQVPRYFLLLARKSED